MLWTAGGPHWRLDGIRIGFGANGFRMSGTGVGWTWRVSSPSSFLLCRAVRTAISETYLAQGECCQLDAYERLAQLPSPGRLPGFSTELRVRFASRDPRPTSTRNSS